MAGRESRDRPKSGGQHIRAEPVDRVWALDPLPGFYSAPHPYEWGAVGSLLCTLDPDF